MSKPLLSTRMAQALELLAGAAHDGDPGVLPGSERNPTMHALQRRGLVRREKNPRANGYLWIVTPQGWNKVTGVPWA